jgi:hypothetical protein
VTCHKAFTIVSSLKEEKLDRTLYKAFTSIPSYLFADYILVACAEENLHKPIYKLINVQVKIDNVHLKSM